ncbi:hypothetical protein [Thiolapillus brandeum]|uniref:Uncharacterized protein n=1 Tax=Thiolapillus brandeum TaxID=1076588 RepID=A0A7U6GJK0_9GAMM|nr:hypothetical protein [Thiolapillus brandeum]BAO44759.1 hypothetical protein TBH_C1844 [Thiolapillus brandeum]
MQHKFDIYFSGEIIEGNDPQQVKEGIGKLFKLSGNKLDALFTGKPRRIKKNLNVEKSGKFREVFRQVGALVHIVPAGKLPEQDKPRNVEETPALWNLMPAGADLNPLPRKGEKEIPIAAHAGENLDMAPISPMPAQPEPESADIDTGSLDVSPAKTGSLEEFVEEKPAVPLPDISALDVVQDDKPIQAETASPEDNLPDISHLQAEPANTGSLEEFVQEKEPVPIPGTEQLSLEG